MSLTITKECPKVIYYKIISSGEYYGPYIKKPKLYPSETLLVFNLTLDIDSSDSISPLKNKPKKEFYKTSTITCEHPLHNRQKGNRCGNCGDFLPLI